MAGDKRPAAQGRELSQQAARALREADLCGQVLWGANNIFLVACEDGRERQCRLRGKTLSHQSLEHNPLACGDFVLLTAPEEERQSAAASPDGPQREGLIYRRLERRNALQRRNIKRGEAQTFAANIDGVILMASWTAPPLRSSFLDRLLLAAQRSGSSVTLLVNKIDCLGSWQELRRLQSFLRRYRKLGLAIWPLSVQSLLSRRWRDFAAKPPSDAEGFAGPPGDRVRHFRDSLRAQLLRGWLGLRYGIGSRARLYRLKARLRDRLYVLLGASGVGKSSLCNYLFPKQSQQTRAISLKWQRGVHTTTQARTLLERKGRHCYRLIDTPGMRNFLPELSPEELPQLQEYYPEFAGPRRLCAYNACQHRREPDCAVRDAAEYGLIAQQRYLSYLNLYDDLENSFAQKPQYQGKSSGNTKGNAKTKGRRGDPGQGRRLKERKRSKLQLREDGQNNVEYEGF